MKSKRLILALLLLLGSLLIGGCGSSSRESEPEDDRVPSEVSEEEEEPAEQAAGEEEIFDIPAFGSLPEETEEQPAEEPAQEEELAEVESPAEEEESPGPMSTAVAHAMMLGTETLFQGSELIYGPVEGRLEHDENRTATQRANVELVNFAVTARFYNPYDSTHSWDYGLIFRDVTNSDFHHSLIVDSDEEWTLFLTDREGEHKLARGTVTNLRLSADEYNTLDLLVQSGAGFFYVNQKPVAILALSEMDNSGDIRVATGFYEGYKLEGESTKFDEFKVWRLKEADSEEAANEEETEGIFDIPAFGSSPEETEESTDPSTFGASPEESEPAPSISEGSAQIPLNWRGIWVGLGVLILVWVRVAAYFRWLRPANCHRG